MYFQQLVHIIPTLDEITPSHSSQTLVTTGGSHQLIIVQRGHLLIAAKDQEPTVCTQGFACHPDYGPYFIQVPKTKEVDYVVITYRVLPETSTWTLYGPLHTISEIKIHYMIEELLRTMYEIDTHSVDEEAAQQFRKRLMMERILFIYLYESRMREELKSSVNSIEETLSYINEHYMLKLTLPMLSRRAGMSEGHYTVLFKKHTGETLMTYVNNLRIEKAKLLFQQTDLLAKEIAQKVGYVDYFHFSRVFKKITGASPSIFQQNHAPKNTDRTSKD
ncbi:AraC family transcriptional regulator [Paenibacillus sp. FSL H7-0331]|uniref:helix-turn-helix transcriptional regulator n=1 Tax=Paenibacillus sp. FSL H7-0331 TaxID=1920421 RepID=UPI00096ECB95|nr:AraC family transcriptional regulator [Paenibacillus sp. FSL H7-0331]OMF12362.1 AraC family transcriptional regulator [Paenibacillus sp. FSL H7-0331]